MNAMRKAALFAALFVVVSISFATESLRLPGLQGEVAVVRDRAGVAHIYARNDHDVYFTHGYIHAADRFFQMDASRRQASGTLAELLGPSALPSDVQLRTLGLRRAAERSLAAYPPDVRAVLHAYADGVNAWLAQGSLPPEYGALELTNVPSWTPLDTVTVAKLLAFGLSFDTIDTENTRALMTYQGVGAAVGFNGTGLFFDDLFRSAPFDPTISIPEGAVSGPTRERGHGHGHHLDFDAVEKARRFLERPHGVPFFAPQGRSEGGGSNWWVVSGAKTQSRNPMLANDPHLSLPSPSVFHEAHLVVRRGREQEPLDVYGVGFPGAPGVIQGYNQRIMWGSTWNPMDVTDYFQEHVVIQGGIPVATMFKGVPEPLTIIPEAFFANTPGDGTRDNLTLAQTGASFVVPRRNNGPLITTPAPDASGRITAISVQYTGFSATREIETFLRFGRAGTVKEFKEALQFFDVGSQNWGYADVDGNIAYFTSAELPLREDLQANTVDGLPPYFIRDGTGALRHEWIRQDSRAADQAIPYQILPFAEMPQLVNPASGYIVNANNDPIGVTLDNNPVNKPRAGGQGILYLSGSYNLGNRVARIERRIRGELARGDEISFQDMTRIQADVKLLDAEILTPFILRAFDSACLTGAPAMLAAFCHDAAVAEAAGRLRRWNFSTPTGLPEGYDAADRDGKRSKPTREEIANSVAATIYSVWRGQALRNVIDATLARISALTGVTLPQPPGDRAMIALRHLLETFPASGSGLNFFDVPGVSLPAAAERDTILLQSLKGALDLLASPAFAPAFAQSTNQDDYRWGKLHRIVLRHPMNTAPFNIGPLAIDGGFEVVDASSHNPRANTVDGFMFSSGPSKRFVGEARRSGIHAVQVIPGGASGDPSSPNFGSLVELWATNDYHEASSDRGDVMRNAVSVQVFAPAD